MRKFTMLSALLCVTIMSFSQSDTTEKSMDEVIVYSNKFAEKKKNIAQKIDVITSKAIAKYNAQNAGDMLINTGNIFVQKSQQGGSSPVIRGFEASRVLLVVDGIRLNNAIYRAGHLQNVITVDQNMLESAEVLQGPSSTIYGSDALGGVVSFRSKSPKLSASNKRLTTGSAMARYSSSNDEKTGHFDISLGGKKLAWLQSYNFSDFRDMKMGARYPDKYPGFGRRDSIIVTTGGVDHVVVNPDSRVQKYSAYKQLDIIQKILFKQKEKITHLLNFQLSNSGDIPRYDRLQDKRYFNAVTGTTLRYAEWYYGPQKRLLGAYELNVKQFGFLDEFKVSLNYQDIEESRQQREYQRFDRFDSRTEKVKVAAFNIDGRKLWKRNELIIGFDGQLNDIKSRATRINLTNGAASKLDTRYPDNNKMNYFGLFAQHLLKFKGDKLVLNDGIRLQAISLHSTIIDNSFFNLPVTDMRQNPFAVTGNVGLVYMPSIGQRVTVNLSSGFRAPNVDDLARVFESSTATRRVIIPNAGIKPEYTYNVDLGFIQTIKEKVRFEVTGFYTLFRNAISPAPFKLNGADSIIYNGVKSAVFANQNIKKAYIMGFNARLKIDFTKSFSFDNTVSYTYGRFKNDNGTKTSLDHIAPLFGKSSVNYQYKEWNTELYALFNGWKRLKDYNPNGEDNGQYATADGMPSWLTLNWRGSHPIGKYLLLQAGVENILNRNYRYFASGFSAPGRNIIVALRANF
ncbi:MAG TPA: TonB-dependent receptor [Chitinophagaceae bacterium]